jgi:ribosomal protein S18 acetylase RimI-like enzyme
MSKREPIKIRKMTAADRIKVFNLLQLIGTFTVPEIEELMAMVDTYLFDRDQQKYLIFIAEGLGNTVVGYVCFGPQLTTDGTFELYHLEALPGESQEQTRQHLFEFAESRVSSERGRLLVTQFTSRSDFDDLREFYLNNDFCEAARIPNYYGDGNHQIILNKRL